MNALEQLAAVALPSSIFLVVLSLGLRTSFEAATYLLSEPKLLSRSMFAMFVVMPACVFLLITSFALHPAVKAGLLALAVSPVPPILPRKELKVAPGRDMYVYGLLVATCLLAIVVAPTVIALVAAFLGIDAGVAPASVARVVLVTVLLPLAVGLALRSWWPASERLAGAAEMVGMILLLAAFALILTRVWPAMGSLIGDGTLLTIVVVAVVALGTGHWLGGPIDDDRSVLALANASRHPGVAIAVVSTVDQVLAPAAILLAFLVSAAATVPYTAWRKRLHVNEPTAEGRSGTR